MSYSARKGILLVIIILGVLIVLAICIKKAISGIGQPKTGTYYPKPSDKVLINPYMGFVPMADTTKIVQPFSMVYAGVSWKEIEPVNGTFDFESFEKKHKFQYWKDKGVKFVIRLYMDYPSEEDHMDIPEWLYDEIDRKGIWYDNGSYKGFSPDYTVKALIDNHRELIQSFAQRYNNDDAVAFVELGSLGHWGEWHNSLIEDKDATFPASNVTDIYVNHYMEFFNNKKLLMRRPYKIAKDNSMGLYNDSFGSVEQTEEYFLNWIKNGYEDPNVNQYLPKMPDYWKTAPSGGEFTDSIGEIFLENDNIDRTIEMLINSHTSWLGPSCPVYTALSSEEQNNLNRILKLIGYRFSVIKSQYTCNLLPGQKLSGDVSIKNSGVAPFYFNWPVYVSLYDGVGNEVSKTELDYDMRKLLPGEASIHYEIKLNDSLPSGVYTLKIYIINPGTGKPGIEFANLNNDDEKRCFIGSVTIETPRTITIKPQFI